MSDGAISALIVVDVQRGFDDAAYWGARNNPACEANIAALIAAWRASAQPIVFVRHDSSTFTRPARPRGSRETASRMWSRASPTCW